MICDSQLTYRNIVHDAVSEIHRIFIRKGLVRVVHQSFSFLCYSTGNRSGVDYFYIRFTRKKYIAHDPCSRSRFARQRSAFRFPDASKAVYLLRITVIFNNKSALTDAFIKKIFCDPLWCELEPDCKANILFSIKHISPRLNCLGHGEELFSYSIFFCNHFWSNWLNDGTTLIAEIQSIERPINLEVNLVGDDNIRILFLEPSYS